MALWILRACFLLVAIGLGVSFNTSLSIESDGEGGSRWLVWTVFAIFVLGALATIVADISIKNKRIDLISSVYFGLIVGFFLTYIVSTALTPLFGIFNQSSFFEAASPERIKAWVVSFLGAAICYSCVSLL
jgi:uncharacterized membrane protein YhaH (DUF805 family)